MAQKWVIFSNSLKKYKNFEKKWKKDLKNFQKCIIILLALKVKEC